MINAGVNRMLKVFSLEFLVADVPCKLITINPSNRGNPQEGMHFQHCHSGCEVHYVSEGTLSLDCIGASFKLSAGQMLIIPPGVYHYVRSVSADTQRMDMLIEIKKSIRSKEAQIEGFLQGLSRSQPILLQEAANGELFRLLRKIQRVTMDEALSDFLRREWLKALCLELVLLMGVAAREYQTEESIADFAGTDGDTDRYIMDQFFNHNYHGDSDMADLAQELNMSVRQTGRVLQKTYGKGFREKMNECRLAVAVDLLRNTDKSMMEISEILGYGESANFSCFIRRQTGKTPAQIRKEK